MPLHRPAIVGIGGFQSNIGKTTLLCELLKQLPGWEAIKTTRGHYRSCGKDPHACCVSHLLGDNPVVHSDKEKTFVSGKDTGRYWEAGASNVHWVIATEEQVEAGIREALDRVRAPGVLIEGNSFLSFVKVDAMFMAAGVGNRKIKASAKRALLRSDAIVLTSVNFEAINAADADQFSEWLGSLKLFSSSALPAICRWQEINEVASRICQLSDSMAA
jgi:molybdopterin-guanine dinucleotide biosynthesis protein